MAEIGGVQVSRGGTIYWGTLVSVLLGTPVAANFLGIQRTIAAWSAGAGAALGGVRTTVEKAVDALFGGVSGALRLAQTSFVETVSTTTVVSVPVPSGVARAFPGLATSHGTAQLNLGPLTFAAGVLIGLTGYVAFLKALQMARGGLFG